MTIEDIKINKEIAQSMDWDELAGMIIELEEEIYELFIHMSKKQMNDYNKLLSIYEKEKEIRVKDNSRIYTMEEPLEYGLDFVSSWNRNPQDY